MVLDDRIRGLRVERATDAEHREQAVHRVVLVGPRARARRRWNSGRRRPGSAANAGGRVTLDLAPRVDVQRPLADRLEAADDQAALLAEEALGDLGLGESALELGGPMLPDRGAVHRDREQDRDQDHQPDDGPDRELFRRVLAGPEGTVGPPGAEQAKRVPEEIPYPLPRRGGCHGLPRARRGQG